MYLSRLTFHALPGRTQEVEERLNDASRLGDDGRRFETKSDAHSL
jgi:hypothetical protein